MNHRFENQPPKSGNEQQLALVHPTLTPARRAAVRRTLTTAAVSRTVILSNRDPLPDEAGRSELSLPLRKRSDAWDVDNTLRI